jgi:hypothetical protein
LGILAEKYFDIQVIEVVIYSIPCPHKSNLTEKSSKIPEDE